MAASSVPGVALDAVMHAHRLSGSRAAPASALSFTSPSRSHGSTAHVPRGIGGAAVTLAVVGAVAFATTGLAGFEETNNEFANYNGPSVTSLVEEFES